MNWEVFSFQDVCNSASGEKDKFWRGPNIQVTSSISTSLQFSPIPSMFLKTATVFCWEKVTKHANTPNLMTQSNSLDPSEGGRSS